MFPPSIPAPGQVLLVTDELQSPADFLLHTILAKHLKGEGNPRLAVLSVGDEFERWRALVAKSNINFTNSHYITFIDVLQSVTTSLSTPQTEPTSLKPILALLSSCIDENTLVILDDISTLQWMGFSVLGLSRFARALKNLCRRTNASLVIRHHIVSPMSPDELFRLLLQLATYHMEVKSLVSGRSGAVSGEIALHAGPATPKTYTVPLIMRSSSIQYRLTDTGAVFFERGTGAGTL